MSKPPVFEILFNFGLSDFLSDKTVTISKEFIFSLINDFEDKKWRFEKFNNFIWDNVIETALSKKEKDALINSHYSALKSAARNLRLTDSEKDPSKGSEIAEILLYGVLKHYFNAIPIVPKIFYKQNTQDFAKGVDGVHIVLNNDETDFTLWFGEAKFYDSIDNDRFFKIVASVKESLSAGKIKKENRIITSTQDLDLYIRNIDLVETIKTVLSDDTSLDIIRLKLHIPILLLYECEITSKYDEKSQKYLDELTAYQKERAVAYYTRQIKAMSDVPKYSDMHFHLIIFPVPSKEAITSNFTQMAKSFRGKLK